ncbi:hypothetical protein BKA70DRAFT_1256284 [Coprinopsis sp. MPI-PUGE-AT-0042]|nr:hypothetical protein BKA70DRAFT_1256284 [Coprinopsis sp. MPI-PUGE-AT-0042]
MGDGDRLGGGVGDGRTGITGQQDNDSLIQRVAELEIVARETKEGLESDAVELQQEKVAIAVLVAALENDILVAMEDAEKMRHEEVRRKSNRASWLNRPLRRHTRREPWSTRRGLQALREQDLGEGAGHRRAQGSDIGLLLGWRGNGRRGPY